jgi:Na+-translocating ferredoxin:NAD+ oxidoreductase RnfE subunit
MVVVSQLLLKLSVRINLLSAKKSRSIVFWHIRIRWLWIATTTDIVSLAVIPKAVALPILRSNAPEGIEVPVHVMVAPSTTAVTSINIGTFPRKLMPNTGICLLIAG